MNGMTESELREMVRASIARVTVMPSASSPTVDPRATHEHTSFARLPLRSGDADGACLIEPSVRCNHCGYCLSYGH
jgi:hypothetical protein